MERPLRPLRTARSAIRRGHDREAAALTTRSLPLRGWKREQGRWAALVAEIDQQVRTVEQQAFDLDAVTEEDLAEPVRPEPYYDLAVLDRLLRGPELLPAGVRVEPLADREYKYSAPGMAEPLRVTTDPEYFEDHASSLELWSPGSPLFPVPESAGEVPSRKLRDVLDEDERPAPATV